MSHLSRIRASVAIDALVENLVRNAPNPIFIKDPEGRYIYVNKAWERTAGVSSEEAVGHTDFDFFPEEIAAAFHEGDLDAMRAMAPVQREERFIKDGEETALRVVKFPIFSEPDHILGTCGISVEVTGALLAEQIRHEERSRLARELHDDALQVMATVGLHLELLEEEHEGIDPGKLEDLSQMVSDVLERLRTLTSDMQVSANVDLDLHRSIQERLEALESEQSMAISLDDSVKGPIHPLVATGFDHIVSEVLINIGKHAHASLVSVSLANDRDGIRLTIQDDGVGFEEGAPRSAEHMGVSGMKARALAMGGELKIHSHPARGTRIEVWAPNRIEGPTR